MAQRVQVDQAAVDTEAKFQKRIALEGLLADQMRLVRVSQPLLKAALEYCKDSTRYATCMFALNRYMLGKLEDVADSQGRS